MSDECPEGSPVSGLESSCGKPDIRTVYSLVTLNRSLNDLFLKFELIGLFDSTVTSNVLKY